MHIRKLDIHDSAGIDAASRVLDKSFEHHSMIVAMNGQPGELGELGYERSRAAVVTSILDLEAWVGGVGEGAVDCVMLVKPPGVVHMK